MKYLRHEYQRNSLKINECFYIFIGQNKGIICNCKAKFIECRMTFIASGAITFCFGLLFISPFRIP